MAMDSNGSATHSRLPRALEDQFMQSALYLWRLMRERSLSSIVFTSATTGEGTTTVVSEIGRLLRDGLGLRPLLVRLNESEKSRRGSYSSGDDLDQEDLLGLSNGHALQSCVKSGKYALPTIIRSCRDVTSIPTTRLQTAISRVLRERAPTYNVVLIDAPAVLASTDTIAVCEVVPQVVLVVEAGQTRYEVVERVSNELRDHDVTIVATILNKHQRVIPNWFYRTFVN